MTQAQSFMYYQPRKASLFIKIVLSTPNLVAPCRALIEQGISLDWLGRGGGGYGGGQHWRSTTYESNVLYTLRFMVDCGVVGGNWVEVPAGQYALAPHQVAWGPCGACQHARPCQHRIGHTARAPVVLGRCPHRATRRSASWRCTCTTASW